MREAETDENLGRRAVELLREAGHDVATVVEKSCMVCLMHHTLFFLQWSEIVGTNDVEI